MMLYKILGLILITPFVALLHSCITRDSSNFIPCIVLLFILEAAAIGLNLLLK